MLLSQYEIVKDITEHTEREFKNDTVSMVPRFHDVHLCLSSRTNSQILRRPKYFHIHLVVGTEASASTLQRNEILLLQNGFLTHVALLRTTDELLEAISAQNVTALLNRNDLLVNKWLHARRTRESMSPAVSYPTRGHPVR